MKFIHCADIHLDSALTSNLSAEKAKARREEVLSTFFALLELAKKNGVTAVIIAGDLFDGRVSAGTRKSVADAVQALSGIDLIYLSGNHGVSSNIFDEGLEPSNFKSFKEGGWTYYRYGGVTVAGMETGSGGKLPPYAELELNPREVNIAVLHGEVSEYKKDSVYLPALRGKSIDYLALGHYHSYASGRLDRRGIYSYSGCLEGRGFDESGVKGFVLLDIDADRGVLEHEFIPFAARKLEVIRADISGAESMYAVERAVEEALSGISRDSLIKLILTGRFSVGLHKDVYSLESTLNSRFYFVKISDESRPAIDIGGYAKELSLRGEFVRLTAADKDLSEKEKEDVISCGLLYMESEGL